MGSDAASVERLPDGRDVHAAPMACWIEWKRLCALGLCNEQTRKTLQDFAGSRFRTYARRCAGMTSAGRHNGRAPAVEAREAWHLFETRLVTSTTAAGKRYKDWLFARTECSADHPLDVIQGGASLIMRDVVREHLRREYSPANSVSTSEPLWAGEGAVLTIEDLLPGGWDPAAEAADRECGRLARERAAGEFSDAARRERVGLAARSLGLSLAHPAVERAAGCRKSVLSAALRALVERVAARVRADFGTDDPRTLLTLSLLTLSEMKIKAVEWARSERTCARLFNLVEDAVGECEAA